MLEWYQAYADYHDVMDLFEQMSRPSRRGRSARRRSPSRAARSSSPRRGTQRLRDAILEHGGDRHRLSDRRRGVARRSRGGHDLQGRGPTGRAASCVDELLTQVRRAEPDPADVPHRLPGELSPLARKHGETRHRRALRGVLRAAWSSANAFSELNDPLDQRERFEERPPAAAGDDEASSSTRTTSRARVRHAPHRRPRHRHRPPRDAAHRTAPRSAT